jgi:ATP-dependent Clp protease ATP-binding subunit ClpA
MFERYTEKARRVIFFARYEASQFGSSYIETEHLLLGLLREDRALTNRFIRQPSSVESIRKQIEERTLIREKVSTSVDLPLSNECKRVLAYAAEEAENLGHKHIHTEHLLLGLLREEGSFAAEILRERGLRLSTLREALAGTHAADNAKRAAGGAEETRSGAELGRPVLEEFRAMRPRIEMVDSAGNVLSRGLWTPGLAIPRAGEYLDLTIRESRTEFRVEKVSYHYVMTTEAGEQLDRLDRIEILLKVTEQAHRRGPLGSGPDPP